MTHISVVTPIYNVTAFLEEAIQSVLSQDFPDKEMIIVDDGSDEEARREIEAICSRYPVKLVHVPHAGQAAARQHGITLAQGDFVMLLDADDILMAGTMTHVANALAANPSAIAAYGSKIRINKEGGFKSRAVFPGKAQAPSGDILPALLQGAPLLSNGNICMRREAIAKVSFPKELRQGEDWVTWCRLALLGDIVYIGQRPMLALRSHGKNTSDEVFENPSVLIGMLDVVFKDPAFIARFGAEKMKNYKAQHKACIYAYMRQHFWQQKQYLRALKYDFLYQRQKWKPERIRVLHIVKHFRAGGAERLLSSLLEHSDHTKYEHIILSLSNNNERLGDIRHTLGIPYSAINMADGKSDIFNWLRCFLYVQRVRPQVLKTWLPPANITGGVIGRLLRIPVIWGIHDAQPVTVTKMTRRQRRLGNIVPQRIVCCSKAVYDTCREGGYRHELLETITNGVDTEFFDYKPEGRTSIRRELGIGEDTLLIGMAAECMPIKRHSYFMAAAQHFLKKHPNTRFLFCGHGMTSENEMIVKTLGFLGLENHVHLLGIRDDMPQIYSAMDIHTLTSRCESFGLAVVEAMACKTLCVATEVGVLKELLSNVGQSIPVTDNSFVLVEAWGYISQMTTEEKTQRRVAGRERVVRDYSILKTAHQYDRVYQTVIRHT